MKFELCTSCNEPTNNYTWRRQRIICRRCWEIEGYNQHLMIQQKLRLEEE